MELEGVVRVLFISALVLGIVYVMYVIEQMGE